MRKLVLIAAFAGLAWFGYTRVRADAPEMAPNAPVPVTQSMEAALGAAPTAAFTCDGRTHCSQMTSCEEATYFIQHCPGTTMDGDNDGVACERQWCQ